MSDLDVLKRQAAEESYRTLKKENIEDIQLGIGTGKHCLIFFYRVFLANSRHHIKPVAVSSKQSLKQLDLHGIAYEDTNMVNGIDIYIDGADEIDGVYEND